MSELRARDERICACGHTRSSHLRDEDGQTCVGCTGPECDDDLAAARARADAADRVIAWILKMASEGTITPTDRLVSIRDRARLFLGDAARPEPEAAS